MGLTVRQVEAQNRFVTVAEWNQANPQNEAYRIVDLTTAYAK